jgi:AcrR family transcriptional regulator
LTVAPRGDQTREHILDVAEQLFGDEGIEKVSMRQIRLAAGQRNAAAVQYHFGDLAGVLRGLSDRHSPRVRIIREEYASQVAARGTTRFRGLVEALVRPPADYVTRGSSERAWIKIVDALLTDPKISMEAITGASDPVSVEVATAVFDEISTTIPADLAGERITTLAMFTIHTTAARARVIDDPGSRRTMSSDELFARNLVDMAVGALRAPLSPARPL